MCQNGTFIKNVLIPNVHVFDYYLVMFILDFITLICVFCIEFGWAFILQCSVSFG